MAKCLNCSSGAVGRYCQNCGQDARDSKRPFKALGIDLLGGTVSYDAKLWLTLWPLLAKPGYLTNEYIAGRRVRYFHPRKMYFFVSIVFFLLFAVFKDSRLFTLQHVAKDPRAMNRAEIVKTAADMAQTANQWGAEVEWLWRTVEPPVTAWMSQYVDLPELDTGRSWRARIGDHVRRLRAMDPELLKERFAHSVANNTPRLFFLLLPVFALIVMVFHLRPKHFYIEHLVFAFHAHIYVFAVASMALVYERFTHDTRGASYALLASLPYLLLSQRAVYREGWVRTVVKMIGVLGLYLAVLAAGIVAVVAMTFWTIGD